MANARSEPATALGFLSVVEHAEHGLFGGYLILNANGRPLEFHCTAPVKANRAQEILYGPTLKPFLYGEQIGQTLIRKAQTEPLLICTDHDALLSLREFCSIPVVIVAGQTPFHPALPILQFKLGTQSVAVLSTFGNDQDLVQRRWQAHELKLELLEPFSRIREAIEEAQRGMRTSSGAAVGSIPVAPGSGAAPSTSATMA
ncbi:MAG: hypothetical protein FJ295_01505 [Planctomycetes bacterium]|nr:hypothetical protein [Planctomycetota bacterium]